LSEEKKRLQGKLGPSQAVRKEVLLYKKMLPDCPSQEEEKDRQAKQIGPFSLWRDLKASSQSESPTGLVALFLPPISQ